MGAIVGIIMLTLFSIPPLPDGVPVDVGPPDTISYGDSGPWVAKLNQELADAGFHVALDDAYGPKTRHAIFAFQKHHGLDTDGVFTDQMWELFDEEIALPYRSELDRVEVDLGKQVLYVVEDGEVTLVLPVSSASGATYRHSGGGYAVARTPEGRFTFDRTVNGWRHAFLGSLYNPFYFTGGYAIHGSSSVPNYPASHGCIRTTIWDMDLLKTRIGVGWTVLVYGKRTSRPPSPVIEAPPPISL